MISAVLDNAGSFEWHMPVQVQFGPHALDWVPMVLGPNGRVVLIVFEEASSTGVLTRLQHSLGDQLLYAEVCPSGLADMAALRLLCRRIWPLMARHPGTVLLGVGGGSVMDLAKVVRCRPFSREVEEVVAALRQEASWPLMHLDRLWLVPTTAGTGSEVTRWATVWDTEWCDPVKRSFDEPFGYAERAFVDPELTLSCPFSVMRDTALDALAHALEAVWNRQANPMSNALAVQAARRVIEALPRACADPADRTARTALSLAALEAGMAFSQTRTALAHALSYELTLSLNIAHGLACAVWLCSAWRLAAGHDAGVDRALAQVFGTEAADGAACLQAWLLSVGVDARPESLGITDAAQRVVQALGSSRGRNFIVDQVH